MLLRDFSPADCFRQKETLVKMRNKKVTLAIRKKYRDIFADARNIPVFCVSNYQYNLHKTGYEEDLIPISLRVTGIPSLRMFALELPAISKLNILRQYLEGTIPSLISSLEMWTPKSPTKRREELRRSVAQPSADFEAKIAAYFEEVESHLSEYILEKIGTLPAASEVYYLAVLIC